MADFTLLACAGCTLNHPVFVVFSMCVGAPPVAYFLLRPHRQALLAGRTWGAPRIDAARIISLALLLTPLVPLWLIGRQERPLAVVVICLVGLGAAIVYLWGRLCWLLDACQVSDFRRELVFLALLVPGAALLGTVIGNWLLGMLLVAPMWPQIFVPYTLGAAVIGAPLGAAMAAGVNYTFSKPQPPAPLDSGDAARQTLAAASDGRRPSLIEDKA